MRIKTRSLQIFIKNCVLKFRQYLTLEQIKWVPGARNPADAATRGMTVKGLRLHTEWMEGPDFLVQEQNTWPNQPEPATNIYADLLPETMQGVKIDQKQVRVRQAAFTTHLQPATDQYYDPVDKDLIRISRWKHLTRIVAVCLRWKNKKRGQINPVKVWEAEKAIVAQSQAQSYRATLVQLHLHGKVNHDNALAHLAPFWMREVILDLVEELRQLT
jgi:hypothetical protein